MKSMKFQICDLTDDEKYIKLALNLAKKASNRVFPNPFVGCVIIKNNRIISTGYHQYFGGPHAEIVALNKIKNKKILKNSTMYINLEPCCHWGKTPPCCDVLIKSGIKRIVISMSDPNPLVNGKGIQILRKNKIEIKTGILQQQAEELNKVYIKYITKKLPYVIIKTAMTIDGKIATSTGDSKWISSDKARQFVHKLRSEVDAVIVGINTVLKDNPELTTHSKNLKNPLRIIIDPYLKIPLNSKVLNIKTAPSIIISNKIVKENKKYDILCKKGIEILTFDLKNDIIDFNEIIQKLLNSGIYYVMIEGGGETNYLALNSGVVDEMLFFISPIIVGGRNAKTPVEGIGIEKIKDAIKSKFCDEIKRFDNTVLLKIKF